MASSTGQVEDFCDVLAAVGDLERLGVVARAVAGRARRVGAREEEQLDRDEALTLAGLAATLGHVEGEPAGAVPALLRGLRGGVQLAHRVEHAGVRREVGPRRPSDRALVDQHQPVEGLQRGRVLGEHLTDQRRLARAGHPGHGGQHAERDVDGHVAQVVERDALQVQPALRGSHVVHESLGAPEQVGAGDGLGHLLETGDRTAVEHPAAALARAGSDVDDPVRAAYDVEIVLDDEQRIA